MHGGEAQVEAGGGVRGREGGCVPFHHREEHGGGYGPRRAGAAADGRLEDFDQGDRVLQIPPPRRGRGASRGRQECLGQGLCAC
eukprot:6208277-Pleurochrysis_carterae.AAC.1